MLPAIDRTLSTHMVAYNMATTRIEISATVGSASVLSQPVLSMICIPHHKKSDKSLLNGFCVSIRGARTSQFMLNWAGIHISTILRGAWCDFGMICAVAPVEL